MAVVPLFLANRDDLVSEIQLTTVSTDDGNAVIDRSILEAREEMYSRLGSNLVTEILTTPTTDAPTTDDQFRRFYANTLEIECTRYYVYCRWQLHVKQEGEESLAELIEDGPDFFAMSFEAQDKAKAMLRSRIDDLVAKILGTYEGRSRVKASTIGPAETPNKPFYSIGGNPGVDDVWDGSA